MMSEQSGLTYSFGGEEIKNDFYAVDVEVDLLNQSDLNGSHNSKSGNNTGLLSFINHHADFSAVHNENQPHAQFQAVEEPLSQNSSFSINLTNNVETSEGSYYSRGLSISNETTAFVDVQNVSHFTLDYQYEWKVQYKLTFVEVKDVGLDSILIKPEKINNNSVGNDSSQMNTEEGQNTKNQYSYGQNKQQSSFSINLHQLQGKTLYDNLLKGQNRQCEGMNQSQKVLITRQTIERDNKRVNIVLNSLTKSLAQMMIEQVPKQIQSMGDSAVKIWKQIQKCYKLILNSSILRDLQKQFSLSSIAKNSKQPIVMTENNILLNRIDRFIYEIPQFIMKMMYLAKSAEFQQILKEPFPKQAIRLVPSILTIHCSVFYKRVFYKLQKSRFNPSHIDQIINLFSSFIIQPLFNIYQTLSLNFEKTSKQQQPIGQILRFSNMLSKLISNFKKFLILFDSNSDMYELSNLTQVLQSENRVKQLQQALIKNPLDFS